MKTLKARINWFFLILIGCSVLITGIFVALLLKDSYIDSLTNRLSKESELIAMTIEWEELVKNPKQLFKVARIYDHTLDVQVTFLDAKGNVMSDSRRKPQKKNQGKYPEVEQLLKSKKVRSFTARRSNHLFAAYPIVRDGKVVGIVRLSLDLNMIDYSLKQVWISLIGGLIVAYALAAFASSRIASRVTKPLEEMTQVAMDITKKRFHRRVREKGSDEVASLARAINRMAHHLQKQMNTIRQSERKLISVIETLESGLAIVDTFGKIGFANQSFAKMYGVPVKQLTQMHYQDLIYPVDLSSLISKCMKKEQKISKEIQLHYPAEKTYEIHCSPILERDEISVVVVMVDMTAIRHLEEMRKDFVANVSHELKTPITSIRGFSETLLDGELKDPETRREFLQIIHDESIRLQRLVGDLLDLSRIESKKMKLTLEETSIEDIIQSVVKTMEDQIRSKNQSLTIHIDHPFQIQVEIDSFRQILINLLSNAIAYTPEEGKIQIEANEHEDRWQLTVRDTGIGIPKKDQARVFERFYRVDKDRSRESGGTGLGLAIVKHLVELHQGTISIDSEIGKGTAFCLTFPKEILMES